MTEHIPGPWEWKWGDLCSSAEDMSVLTIIGAGYGDEHIAGNEADKALIKAAPELLAACEAHCAVYGHRASCRDCWGSVTYDAFCQEAMRLQRIAHRLSVNAIAKAKGG